VTGANREACPAFWKAKWTLPEASVVATFSPSWRGVPETCPADARATSETSRGFRRRREQKAHWTVFASEWVTRHRPGLLPVASQDTNVGTYRGRASRFTAPAFFLRLKNSPMSRARDWSTRENDVFAQVQVSAPPGRAD
jgi:hypothetical protein